MTQPSEPDLAALREAVDDFMGRWAEYRRMSQEAHVWSGADETMWQGAEPVRTALAATPTAALSPTTETTDHEQ